MADPAHKRRAKAAFTLAETLITLAIIGVVAAMIIPSVLNHYREQEIVSKVKKFYSTFSSAIQLAIYENGTVDNWDLAPESGTNDSTSAAKFAEYIKPYLNIMTDCGTDSSECIIDIKYKYLNGSNTSTSDINNINTRSGLYKIILADGSLVWFRTNGNGCTKMGGNEENICAIFYYDINGSTSPNQLGRDLFHFKAKYDRLIPCSEDDCYLDNHGFSCAKYIIEHGNLNYPEAQ